MKGIRNTKRRAIYELYGDNTQDPVLLRFSHKMNCIPTFILEQICQFLYEINFSWIGVTAGLCVKVILQHTIIITQNQCFKY
jgi:hypothetical protein